MIAIVAMGELFYSHARAYHKLRLFTAHDSLCNGSQCFYGHGGVITYSGGV